MAFRSQKAARILVTAGLALAPALAEEFRYEVRHDHRWKSGAGELVFDERGVAYQEHGGKGNQPKHAWNWPYGDIQQLRLGTKEVRLLTYDDVRWKFGADREHRFETAGEQEFGRVYGFLRDRLDQRFVAEMADEAVAPLWEFPVKRLTRFGGSQGTLTLGADRIVYKAAKGESRTWRYGDIENISTSGPFEFTLNGYDRAFRFQLKRPLPGDVYNELWRRIFVHRGDTEIAEKTLKETP